jgi:hypothetical protein
MNVLGLAIRPTPTHFVAFFPKEVEKQLFELEKRELQKPEAGGRTEDDILETKFRVRFVGDRPVLELVSLKFK